MLLEKEVDDVMAKEATSSDNNHIWEGGFGRHSCFFSFLGARWSCRMEGLNCK